MPFPPAKDEKDEDETGAETPETEPGSDMEGGGPITDPPESSGGGMNEDAHLIGELSKIVQPLGIEVHIDPSMSLSEYVQHLCTAFKTHQATKGPEADPVNDNDDDENPNNPQEPELPENAPIMMSAAQSNKLKTVILKQTTKELANRIGVLFQKGFVNDAIRKKLANEVGNIKLSALNDDGDMLPNAALIRIEAYEEQMKAGKPGPFAKKPTKQEETSLSFGDDGEPEEPIAAPGASSEPGKANVEIINRLSGGRYSDYLASKNGK
jgi:hypothetical protein